MKNVKTLLLGGMLLASAAVYAAPGGERVETVLAGRVQEVRAATVKRYVGYLTGIYDVALVPRVSGTIRKQCFKNGDFVKKGQLLFEIEDTTYRAQADSARATLTQSKAEFDFAKSNYERLAKLKGQNAVSVSSYEEALRLYEIAQAAVDAAKAALLDAENNFGYTKIYSPIDGKTDKAAVSPFNYVTPASGKLLTVVSLDPIYLDFAISARDYLSLFGSLEAMKKHAEVELRLSDGKLYPHKAEICFIDNRVDKKTDSIRVRATVKNPDFRLIPDSLVTVVVTRRADQVVAAVLPSAVMNDGRCDYVYVLDQNRCVSRRDVTVGGIDHELQLILSGLKAGEIVIVDGTHKAMPGKTVRPVFNEKGERK